MLKTVGETRVGGESAMGERPPPSRTAIVLAFAAVYVVWGSTYLAMRFAVETLPPFSMAGTRFVIAGWMAYAWARWRGASRPGRRDVFNAFVAGGLMLLGGNGGVVWALRTVPSGMAALVVATVPLWIAILDWLRPGGTRPGTTTAVSLLLGFAGVAWLIGPKAQVTADAIPKAGGTVLVLASLSWAIGSLYTKSYAVGKPFLRTAALQMIAGGTLLLAAGLVSGETAHLDPGQFSGRSVAAMAYLIVFGSLIGYTSYGWLLTVVRRPTLVGTYAFVNPVVAVLLGYALAGEVLSTDTVLAGGVIVVAVALMVLAGATAPARKPGG